MNESGYVYIIQDGQFFKIGSTKNNPHKRLAELQTGNPRELRMHYWARLSNYKGWEIHLHERLSEFGHIRGEWFLPPRWAIDECVEDMNDMSNRKVRKCDCQE